MTALFGTLEFRSPSFLGKPDDLANEGRIYLFVDGGYLHLIEPLPQQDAGFALASFGVGRAFISEPFQRLTRRRGSAFHSNGSFKGLQRHDLANRDGRAGCPAHFQSLDGVLETQKK